MSIDNENYYVLKNYFSIDLPWNRLLKFMYDNNEKLQIIAANLWIKIKNRKVWSDFPELKNFMEKLNKDSNSNFIEECKWNEDWQNGVCNCGNRWHLDGFVVSLLPGVVQSHKDVADSYYLQIIGKSFWKIDGLHVFELFPGDVMFISKTVTHEVSGNGPRSGILITDAIKGKKA